MIYGIPLLGLNGGVVTLNQALQMTILGHVISTDKVLELINCKDGETVEILYENDGRFDLKRHLVLTKRGKEIYAIAAVYNCIDDGNYDTNSGYKTLVDPENKFSKLQRVVWNKITELASAGIEWDDE